MTEDARVTFVLQHPRTKMFLARREGKQSLRLGTEAANWKWVRSAAEAERFENPFRAELPTIFLHLSHYEVRPLLSCGLVGDAVSCGDHP